VIERTLRLLSDLSQGYTSVRRLSKLDTVQVLLEHHTAEHFPFLTAVHSRFRTTFYQVCGHWHHVQL
jgi:exportin-7